MPRPHPDSSYRERLLPAWWVWLVVAGLVLMLAIAYAAALGPMAGAMVGIGAAVLAVAVLVVVSPVVCVTGEGLRVGRALLPHTAISSAEVLDRAGIAALRGPGSDARAFTLLRPWSSPGAVRVTVEDPADPHPAWIVSSRNPRRLVEALAATMGSSASDGSGDE